MTGDTQHDTEHDHGSHPIPGISGSDSRAGGNVPLRASSFLTRAALLEMIEWSIVGAVVGGCFGLAAWLLGLSPPAALTTAGGILALFVLVGAYVISEDAENTR